MIFEDLRAGADKIAINTGAIKILLSSLKPQTVLPQCVVVSVEARKTEQGSYECLTDNDVTNRIGCFQWCQRVVELGAERFTDFAEQEGTGNVMM